MGKMSLADLSRKMAEIDFCMLETVAQGGGVGARPMSNNGEVEYQGDSYFFTWDHSRMAADIRREPQVAMSFVGKQGLTGKPPMFISVQGEARLVHDKNAFAEYWNPDLERWFEQGVDTPGLVMIKVQAARVHYWDGEDDGEITL